MPPRRPKDKGTDAERAVVRYLQANGFPQAERRASNGNADRGDVTGAPGICWEVKYRNHEVSDSQITKWLEETETERRNAGASIGVLVVRRLGVSEANAGSWWAYLRLDFFVCGGDPMRQGQEWPLIRDAPIRMHLRDAVLWLRADGYGNPLEVPRVGA